MTQRKTIYFNVLAGTLDGLLSKSDEEILNGDHPNVPRSLRWYSKSSNPAFHEPYILISCPHNKNKKDVRTPYSIDKDTVVFVDSGGYQLATGVFTEKNYTREIALEWSENNGNIFPILDMPVSSSGNRSYQEVLDFSVLSAKYYADNRKNEDCKILNVLSSNRFSNMERWYNAVKDFKFEGWAYGGHKNYGKAILQSILFLESKGEFNREKECLLHMFGTTSFAVMPYIIYAQHLLSKKGINCQLMYDSSSASTLANYGKYILACTTTGITNIKMSNQDLSSPSLAGKRLGCDCPVCSGITDLDYLFSDAGKWQYYSLMGIHNFYRMNQYKKELEGLIALDSIDVLHSFPTPMVKNFKAMDKAFAKMGDKGIQIIEREFNQDSNAQPIELSGTLNTLDKFF